jgi:glycosyltransferase involved in cell wall biosynthesis
MRVLVPLDNHGGGGIARVGAELVRALAPRLRPGETLRVLDGRGAGRRPGRLGELVADQLRVIGPARRADLVHGIDTKAPLLSATPFAITVHDLSFADHPGWYPRSAAAYKRLTLAAALRRGPRLIVCVSEHTRERLRAHHPEAFHRRVVVIPTGVPDVTGETPADIARHPPRPRDYFLTVSAIEPRKNHLGLLAAFAQARHAGLRLRWRIVGGPQYEAAAILEALAHSDGVELLGRVDDGELERLYAGARFVATPSLEEGFGLPPLEAMRRGVPVVASTGSALDETVADAGLRVEPDDVAGWARALGELETDDGLVARLSAAGRVQAARFSWTAAADAYLAEFRTALGRR